MFDENSQKTGIPEIDFWKRIVSVCLISLLTAQKNGRIMQLMSKGVHFRTETVRKWALFCFTGKKEQP